MNKKALFAGFIGPIIAILFVTVSTLVSPGFSWSGNYLSDIGAGDFGSLPQIIFNGALVIGGLITFVFFLLIIRYYRKGALSTASFIIMAAGSFSLAMIGIFTEHSPYNLHFIFSYGFFILFPMAMILLGVHYLIKRKFAFGSITILMAILALGIIINLPLGNGKAIPEIGEALVLSVWIVLFSLSIYIEKI